MESLDTFKLFYEELPKTRKGGKGNQMPNNKTTNQEAPKASRKYNKTRGEHFKDLVIAVLIAGIIAFVGGMHFANQHNADVSRAVSSVQPVKK